jgi:hypothetical protein
MTEEWLDRTGSHLTIDVPAYQKCFVGTENRGQGGDTTKTGVPCAKCERRPHKDFLPAEHKLPDNGDCWSPKTEAGTKGRQIPVLNERTGEILSTFFRLHRQIGTANAVADAVKRVADRAGLLEHTEHEDSKDEYWPTTHDLRDTFGTHLAVKGFTRDEIKPAMGHETIMQADDYVRLSGRATEQAFAEKW